MFTKAKAKAKATVHVVVHALRPTHCLHPIRTLILSMSLLVLMGCREPKPDVSLKDANLAEGPVIIQRGEMNFYLRYRRAPRNETNFVIGTLILGVKKTGDAGYYFFDIKSKPDFGELIERPLCWDGMQELASHGQIYFLEPDGTKYKIPIKSDP